MPTRIAPTKTTRAYISESATAMGTATGTVLTAGTDYVVNMSTDLLMVLDNDTALACVVNVTSQDDQFGRTNDISESVATLVIVGRTFARIGWADINGDLNINVTTSNCTVTFYEISNQP